MYRETAIPKKPTTKIGEKEGKAYVGIEVIISYGRYLCSKTYDYHLPGVFTTVNHGYLSINSQIIFLIKNAPNLTTHGFIFKIKSRTKKDVHNIIQQAQAYKQYHYSCLLCPTP